MFKTRNGMFNCLVTYILLTLAAISFTWANQNFFTQRVPGGNDFLAHYSVWRGYFRYRSSPFSDEAALCTQDLIYGRPALPWEDQNRLTYPFYSLIFQAPLALFDYLLACAIYLSILLVALISGVWLTLDIVAWQPDKWLAGMVFTWAVLFYPQARGIILGQQWLFISGRMPDIAENEKDYLAGAFLVVSTVKPTLVFLVIPFLLIFMLTQARYKFIVDLGLHCKFLRREVFGSNQAGLGNGSSEWRDTAQIPSVKVLFGSSRISFSLSSAILASWC